MRQLISIVAVTSGVLGLLFNATAAEWVPGNGFRSKSLEPAGAGHTGFTRLGPEVTGITFTNRISDKAVAINRIMENGSGVALGDVDGDGWCDIYLTGLDEDNHLYRNLGGWKFEDITERAGVACAGQFSTGAVFADVDGDGDLDLLVNGIGKGTRLFMNDGHGVFHERKDSGLRQDGASHSLALADADGDGDLDLYVTNYRTTTWHDRPAGETRSVKMVKGKPVVTPADRWAAIVTQPPAGVTLIELGEPDVYYRNDGTGHFTPVPWTDGTFLDADGKLLKEPPRDWGLSVLFRDFTGDGFPDLYICNDFYYSRDRVWINDGHGHFRAIAPARLRDMPETSMAADVGDINRDGHDDLFVVDMLPRTHLARQTRWDNRWRQVVPVPLEDPSFSPEYPRNMLFLNRGDGTWAEIARLAALDATGWSWSVAFLDVDLDGYEDLLVTAGHGRDLMHADVVRNTGPVPPGEDVAGRLQFYHKYPALNLANMAFRNNHDLTFTEVGTEWGFDSVGVSHGMALADLDNDGDLDVVINRYRDGAGIYRNDTSAPRLAVRLRGQSPNTQGIGARVRVLGGPVTQSTEVVSGGRYLSGDAGMRCFAAGSPDAKLQIEVDWRTGKHSRISAVQPNHLYEVQEPDAKAESTNKQIVATATLKGTPLFEDVTQWLHGHTPVDESYNDYERQPLLPRKLSQAGPGLAWFDLDRDGWDDLIVGAGSGGVFTVFANQQGHGFEMIPGARLNADETGVLGWMQTPQHPLLVTANSSYEAPGKEKIPAVTFYDPLGGKPGTLVNDFPNDPGALALGDYDGDGDLDLFVAGRVIPGRYPEAASSRLYRNERGTFVLDESASAVMAGVGLVNGALFSDLNGDGYPDLILACEWGPIRVFGNLRGQFVERTQDLGLTEETGLWQGVATADFDGDGQLDIVASNWGRNSEYHPAPGHPATIWAGDLDGNGTFDIIEAEWDETRGDWAPRRNLDTLTAAMPWVHEKFSTYESFGRATLPEIFGQRLTNAVRYTAVTLDSSVFIAKGGRFERHSLPVQAQFAPSFGVAVGDFDGDGHDDLFLAQNFFPVASDRSRQDGGAGVLLLGDGSGEFRPLSSDASGVQILGEQRGCAVADFDGDGRLDLAVAQNHGLTRLFHNNQARPALRVRLSGPPGNIDAIGTQIAPMLSEKQRGLVREVRSGSGYLSQDSSAVLLSSPRPIKRIWIRWPRGKQVTVAVPANAREIRVNGLGEVTVLH